MKRMEVSVSQSRIAVNFERESPARSLSNRLIAVQTPKMAVEFHLDSMIHIGFKANCATAIGFSAQSFGANRKSAIDYARWCPFGLTSN